MPAIASLEDLKAAQRDLQEAKDLNELKTALDGLGRRNGVKSLRAVAQKPLKKFENLISNP